MANENPDRSSSRIQHVPTQIGQGGAAPSARREPATPVSAEPAPLPVADGVGPSAASKKITAFEKKRHEDTWSRTPNTTGQGAIHVRTFHGKLTDDSLSYMDQCINEWLDAHPQYEVKFVSSTIGTLTGKLKEPHLVCQIWV